MLVISVCVGSSCHLRGSYQIIEELKGLIKSHQVEDEIELKASFCMDNCNCGTSIRVGDEAPRVVPESSTLKRIFIEEVLPKIGRR